MTKKDRLLHEGTVIPAHPLALNVEKQFDREGQKRLTRYYLDAGVGGLAVGVHTTQFEIRDPKFDLYVPVLQTVYDEVVNKQCLDNTIMVAGLSGETDQALTEARQARDIGYDYGLLSFGGVNDWTEEDLIEHVQAVAEVIPLFGFYLQPAVGGRNLSFEFWKEFVEIRQVKAIKVAPFDRFKTLDVIRAVCESSRPHDIALYTGNDDHIVLDLLETFEMPGYDQIVKKHFVGGLLGQWAVWSKAMVDLLEEVKQARISDKVPFSLIQKASALTDANAAIFDASNDFKGSIAGIHYVLKRQGLLDYIHCLSDHERLSPGQENQIERVIKAYPYLQDNEFIHQHLRSWTDK